MQVSTIQVCLLVIAAVVYVAGALAMANHVWKVEFKGEDTISGLMLLYLAVMTLLGGFVVWACWLAWKLSAIEIKRGGE